jgi:hypothetical protein
LKPNTTDFRGHREVDIGFRDTADATGHDVDLHFLVAQVHQRRLQRLEGTAHVRLDHDVQRTPHTRRHALEHVIELASLLALNAVLAHLLLAEVSELTGTLFALEDRELITGIGCAVEAEDFHGDTRTRLFDRLAILIQHCAGATVVQSREHHVPLAKRTALHEQRSHGAAALVEARLDHDTLCRHIARRLQFQQFCLEKDRIQQRVDAITGHRRYVHKLVITAPLLGNHLLRRQFILDAIRVRPFLVNLVDRHDQRHLRRLGVLDRLDSLRHHPVISGDDKNHDVRAARTACAHGRKRGVPRRVEERHHAAVRVDVIRTDVLRDATGFTGRDLGLADVVKERGLAVIDVSHDRDHRRPRLRRTLVLGEVFRQVLLQRVGADQLDPVPQFLDHQRRRVLVDHLVDRRHDPELHKGP